MTELPPILTASKFMGTAPPSRSRWEDRPIEMDTTPVKLRGEPLDTVWWRGRQWAVTEYGIEKLDGTYVIHACDLRQHLAEWPWTSQICMKTWADHSDFMTAWLVALALHGADTTGVRDAIRETAFTPQGAAP
jgi:hypothetical protein